MTGPQYEYASLCDIRRSHFCGNLCGMLGLFDCAYMWNMVEWFGQRTLVPRVPTFLSIHVTLSCCIIAHRALPAFPSVASAENCVSLRHGVLVWHPAEVVPFLSAYCTLSTTSHGLYCFGFLDCNQGWVYRLYQ